MPFCAPQDPEERKSKRGKRDGTCDTNPEPLAGDTWYTRVSVSRNFKFLACVLSPTLTTLNRGGGVTKPRSSLSVRHSELSIGERREEREFSVRTVMRAECVAL